MVDLWVEIVHLIKQTEKKKDKKMSTSVEVDITESGKHHHHHSLPHISAGASGWNFWYVAGVILLLVMLLVLLVSAITCWRRRCQVVCDDTNYIPLVKRDFGF